MNLSRRPFVLRPLAVTAVALASTLAPGAVAAAPGQPAPPGSDDGGSSERADLLRTGSVDDVSTSLDEASADVQEQVDEVLAAREAQEAAEADLAAADAALDTTQAALDDLNERSDEVVVESFVNPPVEYALETLTEPSPTEATVRQSLLTTETNANADLLSELESTRSDVETVKEVQRQAAADAATKADEADAALADLVASQSSETLFVLAVQDRLADRQAEADALEDIDPEAAARIRSREADLAAQIDAIVADRDARAQQAALEQAMAEAAARAEEERASAPSGGAASLGPATGSLSTVACPGGGSITVDSSLAGNLQAMLDDAAAAGNNMCGGGYRDPAEQVALRRSNCGPSDYDIYEAPSSACSPPTARPGTSNHEQGLAVDLTCNGGGALGSGSPCFSWLSANAASYGLYNLPSEPWHWSNDGT